MKLERVWVQNFRSHTELVVEIDSGMTVVFGKNGSGKTNLLEAVYLLATGLSRRGSRISELVRWGEEVGRVKGVVKDADEKVTLEVVVTGGMVLGKKVRPKQLLVNGVGRSREKFVQSGLAAVWFGPADMRIVEGSPTRRRGFLDECLSGVYADYGRALKDYEKGLRRRNKVLEGIRDKNLSYDSLKYWDDLILKSGMFIQKKRGELVAFFVEEMGVTGLDMGIMERFAFVYDQSEISRDRMDTYREREVAAGTTLVGPHRDDFGVLYEAGKQVDLKTFGSRGQQRMGVLWLKLGQLLFVERHLQQKPMLLLDDIFSELDHEHREIVLRSVEGRQCVISAADEHLLEGLDVGEVIRL